MEQLKVIGTEDDVLMLATESGERFQLPVDDVLRGELRRARRERERDLEDRASRPSPREIQSHIRAGLSAEEVATLLDARIEDVRRYERPVLAEREHVVGQALSVPVLLGGDLEQDRPVTFGAAVRAKLAEAGATGERWTSWKEQTGWVVKLEFTASGVDHDARWGFDPRRSSLSPQNSDATQLSRQGSLPEGLIPRLRALDTPMPKDDTRFDSGAFGPRKVEDSPAPESEPASSDTGPALGIHDAAIKRAPDAPAPSTETADLLEALRRRRGQREPLPVVDEPERSAPAEPVSLFDALGPLTDDEPVVADGETAGDRNPTSEASRRRGRTSMPSWDEIVFGARSDD